MDFFRRETIRLSLPGMGGKDRLFVLFARALFRVPSFSDKLSATQAKGRGKDSAVSNQSELVYIQHRDIKFCNCLSEKMTGGHRVRGFAAYRRRKINSVSYGQENKNSVSPCLCV